MLVKCSTCGNEFEKQPHQVKRSKRHFCSKKCQYEGYKKTDEEKEISKKRYQKEYRDRNDVKEKIKIYQNEYQAKNREHLNTVAKQWYAENKDDQNAKSRKRYAQNIDEMREKSKKRQLKWKQDNPDGYFLSRLKYKQNPLTRFKNKARREIKRAEKYNCLIGNKEDILNKYIEISSIDKASCYYCGEDCGLSVPGYQKDITIDHKTPLSRGGDHDIDNMVICCRQCNSLKERKTEHEYTEYVKTIKRLLGE